MSRISTKLTRKRARALLGIVAPVLTAIAIFFVDTVEGPRVAFVGIAASVAFMTANFYGPRVTAFVAGLVVLGTYVMGLSSEDAGSPRQDVRLLLMTLAGVFAVISSLVVGRIEGERTRFSRLARELESSSKLALLDELTGLYNRRGVTEALAVETRWPRSVAILDLDRLKSINDEFGHDSGDHFIQVIAGRIKGSVSASDIVGRWGGDEFIIVLPLGESQAHSVIQRVVSQITNEPIVSGKMSVSPGVSAGVGEWSRSKTLEYALSLADSALYKSKNRGENIAEAASGSTL